MIIKSIVTQVPLWVFSLTMIGFYYIGLVSPEQTNFWIVHYGYPIIFLELLSLFAYVMVSHIAEYKEYFSWSMGFLIILVIIAFSFTYLFNIVVFFYFLLSLGIKYISLRRIGDDDKLEADLATPALSWLCAVCIGLVCSPLLRNFYSRQIELIEQYVKNVLLPGVQITGNIAGVYLGGIIALMGIVFFSCTILISIVRFVVTWKRKEHTT